MLRITFVLLITLIACRSAVSTKQHKTPPGTVLLKENLYIDKTEIANVHWREFQMWALSVKKDTLLYNSIKLDTMVWKEIASLFVTVYHSHPPYNNYPVVGVSYEQALAFCKFRTEAVNSLYENEPSLNPFPGKKYMYRLPTKEEWEYTAAGKLNVDEHPYGMKSIIGTKGPFKGSQLFNARFLDTSHHSRYLSPVNAFSKNAMGVYNMIGNVSEMISEKGIAKGGNSQLSIEQCKIVDQQLYQKAESWLGFRAVCEIVR